jgi:hypothetical protein
MSSLYRDGSKFVLNTDPFIDLLFNCMLGFSFLYLITLLYINPEAKLANVEKQAEFVITASWPDHLADDIDLWVKGPDGRTASYLNKEAGWLHLDRDDRGEVNDIIVIDGQEKIYPVNEEIITVRRKHPGEYIVNLYFYHAVSSEPVPVEIRVDRVNPRFRTVYQDRVMLEGVDHEMTAVRFSVNSAGDAIRFSKLPATLTPYALDHMPSWTN